MSHYLDHILTKRSAAIVCCLTAYIRGILADISYTEHRTKNTIYYVD